MKRFFLPFLICFSTTVQASNHSTIEQQIREMVLNSGFNINEEGQYEYAHAFIFHNNFSQHEKRVFFRKRPDRVGKILRAAYETDLSLFHSIASSLDFGELYELNDRPLGAILMISDPSPATVSLVKNGYINFADFTPLDLKTLKALVFGDHDGSSDYKKAYEQLFVDYGFRQFLTATTTPVTEPRLLQPKDFETAKSRYERAPFKNCVQDFEGRLGKVLTLYTINNQFHHLVQTAKKMTVQPNFFSEQYGQGGCQFDMTLVFTADNNGGVFVHSLSGEVQHLSTESKLTLTRDELLDMTGLSTLGTNIQFSTEHQSKGQ